MALMTAVGTFSLAMLLFASEAPSNADYVQPTRQYEAAINDDSLHQYYVLITVTDGKTGVSKTGCVDAVFLLGAIHHEQNLGYDAASAQRARQIALSNASHNFVFLNDSALKNVGFERFGMNDEDVCRVVRQGHLAYRPHHNFRTVAIDDRQSEPKP